MFFASKVLLFSDFFASTSVAIGPPLCIKLEYLYLNYVKNIKLIFFATPHVITRSSPSHTDIILIYHQIHHRVHAHALVSIKFA